ncbi:MAG: hypothetical protein Q9168_002762 [Polycauliona sp. 1 TL-2023]
MASPTSPWDPYNILGIDRDSETCHGHTRKMQPCRRYISHASRREAEAHLSNISAMDPSEDCLSVPLHELSQMLLCCYHEAQVEDLASHWEKKVIQFNKARSDQIEATSRDRSQVHPVRDLDNQAARLAELFEFSDATNPAPQHHGASRSSTPSRVQPALPGGLAMVEPSTLGRFSGPRGDPIHGNARPDRADPAAVGTEMNPTRRQQLIQKYQDSVDTREKAFAEAVAAGQEADALADMLGGITIKEHFERQMMEMTRKIPIYQATNQKPAPKGQDGIKGNCVRTIYALTLHGKLLENRRV